MESWDAAKDSAAWLIRKYAARLARHPGLRHRHADDLKEELWGELGAAWCSYKPEIAQPTAYASAVVHNAAVTMARRAAVRYKRLGGSVPLDRQEVVDELRSLVERDLQLDMTKVVQQLPPDLQQVAQLLAQYGPAEVARKLGRTRSWVYRARDSIADRFRDAGLDRYLEERASAQMGLRVPQERGA